MVRNKTNLTSCRVTDGTYVRGIPSVTLENAHIKVVVLAGKGADIFEFRHKATDTDLLFKTPWGVIDPKTHVHDTFEPGAPFMDFYQGGWHELFPNAGGNCTYRGAELGVHGEICKVAWDYQITEESEQRVSVKFWVRTARTPFFVEKKLSLRKDDPTLFIEETVTNEGSEPMDFMWGHHPALGAPFLSEHCRLFLPGAMVETAHALPARQVLVPETRFESFPIVKTIDGADFDLSRIAPPSAGIAHLIYLSNLADGWYCVVNEQTKLGFGMRWDVNVFRYLWLWQEFGGTRHYPWWGRGYVVAVEPQSSLSGLGLQNAIERGTQLTLSPGERLSTSLCASIFIAEGEPKGICSDGRTEY